MPRRCKYIKSLAYTAPTPTFIGLFTNKSLCEFAIDSFCW